MSAKIRVEYLMEAALLGIFMISACAFVVLLDYPSSPVRQALPDPNLRRLLTGLAMGSTAVALIYSPWGMQSGAHFTPATTLTGRPDAPFALQNPHGTVPGFIACWLKE